MCSFWDVFLNLRKKKKNGDPGARTQPEPSNKLHREAEASPHAGSEASAGCKMPNLGQATTRE
jgi:hypothetical protein